MILFAIWYGTNREGIKRMEEEVNEWLRRHGEHIEIISHRHAQSGRIDAHVSVSIFYRVLATV